MRAGYAVWLLGHDLGPWSSPSEGDPRSTEGPLVGGPGPSEIAALSGTTDRLGADPKRAERRPSRRRSRSPSVVEAGD